MKIVSKFSDYYDIGLAYGIDEKLRFVRKSQSIKSTLYTQTPILGNYTKQSQRYRITYLFNLIGFCDTMYPFVRTTIEKITRRDKKDLFQVVDSTIHYDMESLETFCQTKAIPFKDIKQFETISFYSWNPDLYKLVKKFYGIDYSYNCYKKVFQEYKIPYFVLEQFITQDEKGCKKSNCQLLLLPILKNYKFAKVVTPMQAFQEICMYLGQLDLAEDRTVTIEDKYLAQGKGFNCYSFKKMSTKKKQKKC